jgi:uncharacterized Zn finger protein
LEALDGNAIAGPLFEYFGAEMTTTSGTCAHCEARNQIGELRVYNRAPGAVVRCPNCGNVLVVLVNVHNTLRVDLSSFQMDSPAAEPPSTEQTTDR